jgi:osmotically-inducible protein OsmY
MKTFVIGLLFGAIIGAGAIWYFTADQPVTTLQETQERAGTEAEEARESIQTAGEQARQAWDARLEALQLRAEDIREELAEDSRIIRRKARDFGEATVDVAMDTRTTATIKAKLAADEELSVFDVSVSTTQGYVTLSGTVASPELIGRATALALETEGVREVTSVLKVQQ